MAVYKVLTVREMAFSESCMAEVQAESWEEACGLAYAKVLGGEGDADPVWDANPPETVSWFMEEVDGG
jgi:hypothetical protein